MPAHRRPWHWPPELAAPRWAPLTVDPAADNPVAISAWQKAGFAATGERGLDGRVTTVVMAYHPIVGTR